MPQRKNIDTIRIEQLELSCLVGVNPWERLTKQQITVDVELDVDLSPAGASDTIADTIDYRTIVNKIVSEIDDSKFALVEALATRIAEICLEDDRVLSAEVTLRKPGAIQDASSVGVIIRRSR
jgi:FolB domain-containing protein|tara:strand:- start:637 stop:1005 length:369 start_codon:yes stop_codon:yes gene_type:complete